MCGIVGAIAERNVVPILIEGLKRLEYRGYDSAGVAVLNGSHKLARLRTVGKVRKLEEAVDQSGTFGNLGIAHTRWATHGAPSERNAHPHVSQDGIAIVHNGIIENYEELRRATSSPRTPTPRSSRTASTITCRNNATCSRPCAPRSPSSRARTHSQS
jgi:glucosamine--fructose-6-phosphate aminotransferase (isomerizing)